MNKQQKKIYQNMAKKESRKRNPESVKINNKKYYEKQKQKIATLEVKLAEKEKEIEKILKENETLIVKHNVYCWGDEIQHDKIYAVSGEALDLMINNKDEINFAIEQLEKVKEKIQEDRESLIQFSDIGVSIMVDAFLCDCKNYIDNQIEELKKEMK